MQVQKMQILVAEMENESTFADIENASAFYQIMNSLYGLQLKNVNSLKFVTA
jgi:hypothetical protein